jgi:hypothetical protein
LRSQASDGNLHPMLSLLRRPLGHLTVGGCVCCALLLGACDYYGREETPAYFNSVTGLHLCETALLKNRRTPETDMAGLGVVYVVAIRMTPACEADFRRQVAALREKVRPGGTPIDDTWIDVETVGEDLIVTYTT